MCRVLGVIGDDNVNNLLVLGLCMQIYAGEHSTGIASLTDGGIRVDKKLGKAVEVFPVSLDFIGNAAIGHNGCATSELQPICLSDSTRQLALSCDATREATIAIADLLRNAEDVLTGVKMAMRTIEEPFALIVLSAEHGLIAARNSGIKPLTFGKIEIDGFSGFYAASQSGVLIDGLFLDTVAPGSIQLINQAGFEEIVVMDRVDPRHCVNEVLFKQRPGNHCGGREINQIRLDIGRRLGEKFLQYLAASGSPSDEYKGIAIPEGGRQFTLGFGLTSGIEVDPAGSVKSLYSVSAAMRASARKLGFSDSFDLSLLSNVKGRRVILIDDQIRSGGKIAHLAKQALKWGAEEVIAAVGSIGTSTCPYGDAAYNSDDLIDRRLTLPEISQALGVTTIITLPLEELIQAINTPQRLYCVNCLC